MKHVIKAAGTVIMTCAVSMTLFSCGSSTTTTTTTNDSAVASPVASPDTTPAPANASAPVNKNSEFVTDVSKANAGEIAMLQAGVDKGTNKMLKADAKKMLADHQKLAKDMGGYAANNNITVPAPDNMDMSDMDSKTGKDWDKAWTDKMVDGHQKTIARFEKGQNEVTDPTLKGMITQTLPTLHKHLDMVTALQGSLK